ncbi:hypothetical protein [Streptomyces sp. MMBL 11-3]|uniref:hypothetical protein n=1 Tax=Streptomyces sp. MMBL 11-3 TaxID=3382639 RepID=UPI0039B493C8
MEAKVLRACWKWRNYPPGHEGGGARADAEVLLNTAGRGLLAIMCGVEEDVLARALPSWAYEDAKLHAGASDPVGLWRSGGAVTGPVAFGCRLCTARRTGACGRCGMRRGGSGCACAMDGGCWMRMPTSRWNIWICAVCRRW